MLKRVRLHMVSESVLKKMFAIECYANVHVNEHIHEWDLYEKKEIYN